MVEDVKKTEYLLLHLVVFLFLFHSCGGGFNVVMESSGSSGVSLSPALMDVFMKGERIADMITDGGRLMYFDEYDCLSLERSYELCLDYSPEWIGIDSSFYEKTGLGGAGVVIGFVDTGIDWTHPDFRDGEGQSRILYILDYSLPAIYPDPYPSLPHGIYRIYGKEQIDYAISRLGGGVEPENFVESIDTFGHGTHIASIAAGNDPDGVYVGVAPEAYIVMVKGLRKDSGKFEEIDIINGVSFIFTVCDILGLACVVNLSLGGRMGAHDGTSYLERKLSQLLEESPAGRVIVASAGNMGSSPIHAIVDIGKSSGRSRGQITVHVPPNVPEQDGGISRVVLDIWIKRVCEDDVSILVQSPDGRRIGASFTETVQQRVSYGAFVSIAYAPAGPDPVNGDREAVFSITGDPDVDGRIPAGDYVVEFKGCGAIDVYLAEKTMKVDSVFDSVYLAGDFVTSIGTEDIPATCDCVISAGAIVVRKSWEGRDGQVVTFSGNEPGQVSSISSVGPARDGRFKPEFVLPGEWISAALSDFAPKSDNRTIFHGRAEEKVVSSDGRHIFSRGTSQSAALLAGMSAILLQVDPSLTQKEIEAILIFSSLDNLLRVKDEGRWLAGRWGFSIPDLEKAVAIAGGAVDSVFAPENSAVIVSSPIFAPDFDDGLDVYVIAAGKNLLPIGAHHDVDIVSDVCVVESEVQVVAPGLFIGRWHCGGGGSVPPVGTRVRIGAYIDGQKVKQDAEVLITSDRMGNLLPLYPVGGGCNSRGN